MRLVLSVCLVLCSLAFSGAAQAQRIPKDFRLELTAGPIHEQYPEYKTETNRLVITADGTVTMGAWNSPYGRLKEATDRFSKKEMRALYKVLRSSKISGLQDAYINPRVAGGDLAQLILTETGNTKTVRLENVTQADVMAVIRYVNALLPDQRSILTMAMFDDAFPQVPR